MSSSSDSGLDMEIQFKIHLFEEQIEYQIQLADQMWH